MRKVLMLAYVFPPFFSAGGSIRAVKFVKYLPGLDWQPLVLTIDDSRETVSQKREGSEALLAEIPPEARVYRTPSGELSAALQQKGREARRKNRAAALAVNVLSALRRIVYRYVFLPDAHITWLPVALREARRIVRAERVDVVWATCPPHSTAIIAALLKRLMKRPLVLDYRDDWIDTPWYRAKPRGARWFERRLEQWAVHAADCVVLVTEASRSTFIARYGREPAGKFALIPNGCDLDDFAAVRKQVVAEHDTFNIVHAGLLSVDSGWRRSPRPFFDALRQIAHEHPDVAHRLAVTFTGCLPEAYRGEIERDGLCHVVREAGFLPHEVFLRLLHEADLLLTINYEGFDTLIPGKIYEYWAVGGAPILLLDGEGAARRFVRHHDLGWCVSQDDTAGIAAAIVEAYRKREAGAPLRIHADGIQQFDRKELARHLAALLDEVSRADTARGIR